MVAFTPCLLGGLQTLDALPDRLRLRLRLRQSQADLHHALRHSLPLLRCFFQPLYRRREGLGFPQMLKGLVQAMARLWADVNKRAGR